MYLLPDILVGHIARPSLSDEPGPLGLRAAAVWLVLVLGQTGQEEPIRQETLPCQHDATVTDTTNFNLQVTICLYLRLFDMQIYILCTVHSLQLLITINLYFEYMTSKMCCNNPIKF